MLPMVFRFDVGQLNPLKSINKLHDDVTFHSSYLLFARLNARLKLCLMSRATFISSESLCDPKTAAVNPLLGDGKRYEDISSILQNSPNSCMFVRMVLYSSSCS